MRYPLSSCWSTRWLLVVTLLLVGCGGDKTSPGQPDDTFQTQLVDRWWSRQGYGADQTKDYYFHSQGPQLTVTRYRGGHDVWQCDYSESHWEILAAGGKVLWDQQVLYFEIESLGSAGIRLLEFDGETGQKGELRHTYVPEADLESGPRECCPTCPGPGRDSTPPTVISDLRAMPWGIRAVRLLWTAPSDAADGKATEYDLRESDATIAETNWISANQIGGEPAPGAPRQAESFVVTGWGGGPDDRLFWALKSRDKVPRQWSDLSNVVTCFSAPPAKDLSAGSPSSSTVKLSWIAPGDPGMGVPVAEYDIRYGTATITDDSWAAATRVTLPVTARNPGDPQELVVSGLQSSTRYYFALRIRLDQAGGWSGLSPVAVIRTTAAQ